MSVSAPTVTAMSVAAVRICSSGKAKAAVTFIAAVPASSSTVARSRLRLTAAASSSSMVTDVPVTEPPPKPVEEPVTVTERLADWRARSSTGIKSNQAVPEVVVAGMVMLRSESSTAVK